MTTESFYTQHFGPSSASSSSPLSQHSTIPFSVLSYNVWGLFTSQDVASRMKALAEAKLHLHDIVCLQENFNLGDYNTILNGMNAAAAASGLPPFNGIHDVSSFVGPGSSIITRFPILSHNFYQYPVQGVPELVLHGDYYANKGVSVTRLQVAKNTTVVVYNTHMVAQYEQFSKLGSYAAETYAAMRLAQAAFYADVIASTASAPTDNVIMCGDFNCGPASPELTMLSTLVEERRSTKNKNIWTAASSSKVTDAPLVKALPTDAVTNITYSFDNSYNSSPASYFQILSMTEDIPVQLDHIIYRHRPLKSCNNTRNGAASSSGVLRMVPYFSGITAEKKALLRDDIRSVFTETRGSEGGASRSSSPSLPIAEVSPQGVVFSFTTPEHNGGQPLSDHWAVSCRFVVVGDTDINEAEESTATQQAQTAQSPSAEATSLALLLDAHSLPRPNQFFNRRCHTAAVEATSTNVSSAPSSLSADAAKAVLAARALDDSALIAEMLKASHADLELKKAHPKLQPHATAYGALAPSTELAPLTTATATSAAGAAAAAAPNPFDAYMSEVGLLGLATVGFSHVQSTTGDIFFFSDDRRAFAVPMLATIIGDKVVDLHRSKKRCFSYAIGLAAVPLLSAAWLLLGTTGYFFPSVSITRSDTVAVSSGITTTTAAAATVATDGSSSGVSALGAAALVGASAAASVAAIIVALIGKLHREANAVVLDNAVHKLSLL